MAKKKEKSPAAPSDPLNCDYCPATNLGRAVKVNGGTYCGNGRCSYRAAQGIPYSKWND